MGANRRGIFGLGVWTLLLFWVSPTAMAQGVDHDPKKPRLADGIWRAWLDSPGGELPFQLELRAADEEVKAWIHNGEEKIEIPEVKWVEDEKGVGSFVMGFPHYDSEIRAQAMDIGRLDGVWRKRRGLDDWREMDFHAVAGNEHRFLPTPMPLGVPSLAPLAGRYRIDFESSDDPAVGIFEQDEEGLVRGTILTTTGDYRYLAGRVNGNEFQLSVFDGAHAFLFRARRAPQLTGDFWSSDSWHEKWTAVPDEEIQLPDPWEQVGLIAEEDRPDWTSLQYSDLAGKKRALNDPAFQGNARLMVLFGSWCPNCHDESHYLKEIYKRYHERGLNVLGLGFEITGDADRDLAQLARYKKQMQIPYPLLLAGSANKKKAALAFPILSQVKSYPTTLFIDKNNKIRWVWSGFSGPATGTAHQKLRAEFENRIEKLLAE